MQITFKIRGIDLFFLNFENFFKQISFELLNKSIEQVFLILKIANLLKLVEYSSSYDDLNFSCQKLFTKSYDDHMISTNQN